jgi:hypothetical protein
MEEKSYRGRAIRTALDSIGQRDRLWANLHAADVRRRSGQAAKAVVSSLEHEAVGAFSVGAHLDTGPPTATECAKKIGLIGTFEAQRIMARGRSRGCSARPGDVFVHTLIHDEPLTAHGQLEA